ncbi:MAG: hypothetical protein E7L00_05660 [Propionibacteriaceae bacterium]|nr:hypothetical protein [Propionibacteriaceae bacterium]
MARKAAEGWERLVATYSVDDVQLAARYALAPDVLLEVSGADRIGDLPAIQARVGYGLVRQAGPERDGRVPVAVNPCALVREWLHGTDEERRFMR